MRNRSRFRTGAQEPSAAARPRSGHSRSATIVVCVLACLVVTSGLIAATVQNVLRSRREVRLEHQLLQTELLCEAGVARAVGRWKQSSEYAGETWSPRLSDMPWDEASVEIHVQADDDDDQLLQVEVVARLGSEALGIAAMQRSYTFTIEKRNAPAPSSSEKQSCL